jgi:hypothetical protein
VPVSLVVADTAPLHRRPIAQAVARVFSPQLFFGFVPAEEVVPPAEIPDVVIPGYSGRVRRPIARDKRIQAAPQVTLKLEAAVEPPPEVVPQVVRSIPRKARQEVKSQLVFVTADVQAPVEETPNLVVAEASNKVRRPITRNVRGLQAEPQVLFAFEAAAEEPPPAEETPNLVVAGTANKVRKPIAREVRGLRVTPQDFRALVPADVSVPPVETIPSITIAGIAGNVRKPMARERRWLQTQSQDFSGLFETVATPPVGPISLVAADVNYFHRKPIGPPRRHIPVLIEDSSFFDVEEFFPIVNVADVQASTRAPFPPLPKKVIGGPKVVVGVADPVPAFEGIPYVVSAPKLPPTKHKVGGQIVLQLEQAPGPEPFLGVPFIIRPTRLPFGGKQPDGGDTSFFFDADIIVPGVIARGTTEQVRGPVTREPLKTVFKPQIIVGREDPLPPPEDIPSLLTPGVAGNIRKAVKPLEPAIIIRPQIIVGTVDGPPLPPADTDWKMINAIDFDEGKVMKLWVDVSQL